MDRKSSIALNYILLIVILGFAIDNWMHAAV